MSIDLLHHDPRWHAHYWSLDFTEDEDEPPLPRSPKRCRRHPRADTCLAEAPFDFDLLAELLTGGVNVEVAGVLLCQRCLGDADTPHLFTLAAARHALRDAGIVMPITRFERTALGLEE
jgi:hypothetical protein